MIKELDKIVVRPDIIQRRVWMGQHQVWVIKDPISGDFYHFGEREHQVLSLADGRTVNETIATCRQTPETSALTSIQVSRFLEDAIRKRLISIPGMTQPIRTPARPSWYRNPLAIKFPGITPSRTLDRCLPLVSPFMSLPAAIVTAAMMVLAVASVVSRFDVFATDVAGSVQRLSTPLNAFLLMVIIGGAKIVHELAHAMACRRMGGHVRELGVMLLVGIPCLYCDVSDAWLFDRRWKRIVVSAAGIWAELVLACIATFVWLWAVDGAVRDICVTVMMVCSVSTIFFNGNPLLRYDGYYIFADLICIPNLASRSKAMLRAFVQRWLWGIPVPAGLTTSITGWSSTHQRYVLLSYGILSSVYRTFVMVVILWWIYRTANHVGFGRPAGIAILGLVSWAVVRRAIDGFRPAVAQSRSPAMWIRGVTRGLVAPLCLLCIAMIPLPRHVRVPMTVQPAGVQALFVTTPGRLKGQASDGMAVRRGQPIVELRNPAIERELIAQEMRSDSLRTQLANLRKQRSARSDVSLRLPVVERAYLESTHRLALLREQSQQLLIRSPKDGWVFAAQARTEEGMDERLGRFWTGDPLDPINRNAWLEQGTMIGVVGDATHREAILMIPQEQIGLIRTGQSVSLMIASLPSGSITGSVSEVAVSPSADSLPDPLTGRPADAVSSPRYQVRVGLDAEAATLPVRLRGHALITVDRASALSRIKRFLAGTFASLPSG